MSETFDAGKITWTRYATADELADRVEEGWEVSSYYGQRGSHDCYVIVWSGEGMPPGVKNGDVNE